MIAVYRCLGPVRFLALGAMASVDANRESVVKRCEPSPLISVNQVRWFVKGETGAVHRIPDAQRDPVKILVR